MSLAAKPPKVLHVTITVDTTRLQRAMEEFRDRMNSRPRRAWVIIVSQSAEALAVESWENEGGAT